MTTPTNKRWIEALSVPDLAGVMVSSPWCKGFDAIKCEKKTCVKCAKAWLYESCKAPTISFNMVDFQAHKYAVNCRTEYEAKTFLLTLHNHGLTWANKRNLDYKTKWYEYRENTCYTYSNIGVMFSSKPFYEKEEEMIVIDFALLSFPM